jgi:hypothetical protein
VCKKKSTEKNRYANTIANCDDDDDNDDKRGSICILSCIQKVSIRSSNKSRKFNKDCLLYVSCFSLIYSTVVYRRTVQYISTIQLYCDGAYLLQPWL